jgi:hypothetical protein
MLTLGVTTGSMVIVIAFEVAGLPVTPDRLEVMTQVTTWPVVSVVVVKVLLLVPTLVVPTFHWYVGAVPPLVGVAVKVRLAPAQAGLAPLVSAMLTEATVEAEILSGIASNTPKIARTMACFMTKGFNQHTGF